MTWETHRAQVSHEPLQEVIERMEIREGMEVKMSPQEMPEIGRELTILQGAITSVEKMASEVLEKIHPVLRQPSPETVRPPSSQDELSPETDLGLQLRKLTEQLSVIEDKLTYHLYRIAL